MRLVEDERLLLGDGVDDLGLLPDVGLELVHLRADGRQAGGERVAVLADRLPDHQRTQFAPQPSRLNAYRSSTASRLTRNARGRR